MRLKTQSGKVVSSHSSACGWSSFSTNDPIDSRRRSCSSVKMKWRRFDAKSGRMTGAASAAGETAELIGSLSSGGGRAPSTLQKPADEVNSGASYFP